MGSGQHLRWLCCTRRLLLVLEMGLNGMLTRAANPETKTPGNKRGKGKRTAAAPGMGTRRRDKRGQRYPGAEG